MWDLGGLKYGILLVDNYNQQYPIFFMYAMDGPNEWEGIFRASGVIQ